MKTPNRTIDRFPYSRVGAEGLIQRAQDVVSVKQDFLTYAESLRQCGDRAPFEPEEHLKLHNFASDIEFLITATFPELLPIEWEIER